MPRGIAKDHDHKRAAIRKGAAEYFADRGFDRASMTAAAQHCGVSKALLYHYYDSKDDLLFDILDTHLSALEQAVQQARAASLRDLIRTVLMAYEGADAEHKLQLDALQLLPHDLRQPLIEVQRRMVAAMSGTIDEEFPGLPPETCKAMTMSIFGILNWFYMWHRPGRGISRDAYARLAGDFVIGGLREVAGTN